MTVHFIELCWVFGIIYNIEGKHKLTVSVCNCRHVNDEEIMEFRPNIYWFLFNFILKKK